MIFQQILLAINEEPDVAPPSVVPSGDPFIIDLDFPGLATAITLDAVYTFPQTVSFPIGSGSSAGQCFIGSTVTYIGNTIIQVNFHLHPADTSTDAVDLVFTNPPQFFGGDVPDGVQKTAQISDQIWWNAHASGGTGLFHEGGKLTFYSGEQLYLQFYYDGGVYYSQPSTIADVHLHLVGEAV